VDIANGLFLIVIPSSSPPYLLIRAFDFLSEINHLAVWENCPAPSLVIARERSSTTMRLILPQDRLAAVLEPIFTKPNARFANLAIQKQSH
jgi:hypothetical protein